jgi:putative DNA topoisomerase
MAANSHSEIFAPQHLLIDKIFFMKLILVLFIAIFSIQITFAQKAKAFEKKLAIQTFIITGNTNVSLSPKERMKTEVTKSHNYSTNTIINNYSPVCPQCKQQLVVNRAGSKQANNVYTCNMHLQVACNKNGECPICHKS